jgi:hypothetical protein
LIEVHNHNTKCNKDRDEHRETKGVQIANNNRTEKKKGKNESINLPADTKAIVTCAAGVVAPLRWLQHSRPRRTPRRL